MKDIFFIIFIVLSAIANFGWSWKRLLDFNSYQKPFLEGTVLSFLILFIASLWWLFVNGATNGLIGVFYYFISFLIIMVLNGSILGYLFSKKNSQGESEWRQSE